MIRTSSDSSSHLLTPALRLIAALTALFVLLIGAGLLLMRVTAPMPSLLYRTNDQIRLHALRCQSALLPCIPDDRVLLDHLDSVDSMAQASPDGMLIAVRFSGDWRLYAADCLLASTSCPGQPMGLPAETTRLAWGPNGDALLILVDGGSIIRVLTRGCLPGQTGICRRSAVSTGLNGVHTPAWSADGTRIVLSGPGDGLLLLDAACLNTPTTCRLLPYQTDRAIRSWWASLSADGGRVLFQENAPSSEVIVIRNLIGGQRQALTPELHTLASTPSWDTSEHYLAYVLSDFNTAQLIIVDLARGRSVRLTRPSAFAFFPEWLPAQ